MSASVSWTGSDVYRTTSGSEKISSRAGVSSAGSQRSLSPAQPHIVGRQSATGMSSYAGSVMPGL